MGKRSRPKGIKAPTFCDCGGRIKTSETKIGIVRKCYQCGKKQ